MNKTRSIVGITGALILGVLLTLLLLVPVQLQRVSAQTGYTAIPRVLTINNTSSTISFTTAARQWNDPAGHYAQTTPTEADIFLHVVMPISNTTTYVLQVSADMVNWANHTTLAAAVVADSNTYTTVNTIGQYFRIVATTPYSTDAYTSTIFAVLRRDDVAHPGSP